MTRNNNRGLSEAAVTDTLVAAGWTPATYGGRRCAIDEWANAGDFSTLAERPRIDGSCASVLLSCRTAYCVPTLTAMAAALRRAGFATVDTDDGLEFLRILPSGSRGRQR